ncbi:MAG: hypothetical protein QXD19_06525 [Candidatus Bathyarchaeia archaeon]
MKFRSTHIVTALFLEVIALCLIASLRFINIESTIALLIFNLLFLSLTFQLNGSLSRKMSMLALGNIIGLAWNFSLNLFAATGTEFFGEIFTAFYALLQPIFNFMGIISFWSVSLSFFTPENMREAVKA